METMIELRNIVKSFQGFRANDDISLTAQKGEIVALLGENGAGKSTLMNILFGLYQRDSGSITIDGREMPMSYSPQQAIESGIAMVHQHLKLVEPFTVAQNVILGAEKTVSRFFYRNKVCNQKVRALCERYHMNIKPDSVVSTLPLGAKQRVEILKALYRGCRILILDEPTTVLTPQETDALFALLRQFQKDGMTILIITHKLHEVMAISDRVMVLRQGKCTACFNTAETSPEELAATMIGRKLVKAQVEACGHAADETPSMELVGIRTASLAEGCWLKGLDLRLYAGHIVGLAGVDGNGQTALVEVLAGITKMTDGEIRTRRSVIRKNTTAVMRAQGIRMIPEDRHRQGLVLPMSTYENILIGYRSDKRFVRAGVFRTKQATSFVQGLTEAFDIRPRDEKTIVRSMSGGNQQKVVLARELSAPELQVVVASQPTRGLDAGAIQAVHNTLLRLRAEGKTILLISSDLEEIKALSDEIAVLHNGVVAIQKAAGDFTDEQIGLYMGGGQSS